MSIKQHLLYTAPPIFAKGGSSAPEPTRVTDNLRSQDTVEVLLGLGEGPWSKLSDGMKSFYIANTPLQASDGTLNFPDAQLIFHKGSALPDPIKFALGGSGQPSSVNVNLAQGSTVTRTTTTGNIDAIDVRIRIDQLMLNTEEGDQLNEDLLFKIEVKPTSSNTWAALPSNTGWLSDYTDTPTEAPSGLFAILADRIIDLEEFNTPEEAQVQAWEEYQANVEGPIDVLLGVETYSESIRVYGRTQSPVMKEIRIPVTRLANDTYDIRVTKQSAESTSTSIREVTWESFEQITIGDQSYPNTAMAQLILKASDQISSVPQMYGIYDMAEILVPSIYDPIGRSYDFSQGPWDGTFKVAHTDDLAWIIYDLVHNDTHGIAAYYNIAFSKYEALEASLYWNACNEATGAYEGVPRPAGGTRPRTTFNGLITTPRNSMELLTYMAGAGNAVFYEDVTGDFRLRVEKNSAAVQTFNNMDVENGVFQYSFTDVNTRYNDITVVYRNKNLPAYQEDRRRVFDQVDIDENGSKPLVFAAVGCVDTDEAITRAYHKLITSLTETQNISFTTSRFGAYVEPHDIILISDEAMDEGQSRRCVELSPDGRTIKVNEPLPLEVGVNDYVCRIQTTSGIVEFLVDEANSTPDELRLFTAVNENIDPNFSFSVMSTAQGDLRAYRVTSVEEGDGDETIKISAIEVNRAKYSLIDNFDGTIYDSDGDDNTINESKIVQDLEAVVTERATDNGKVKDINLTWASPPNTAAGAVYSVSYAYNDEVSVEVYRGSDLQYVQRDVPVGRHTFAITTLNVFGFDSPQVKRIRVTTTDPDYGLPSITGITIENQKGTSNTSYIGINPTISWSVDTAEKWEGWEDDRPHPDFFAYNVDVVNPSDGEIVHTYVVTDWQERELQLIKEEVETYGLDDIRAYSVVITVVDEEENEGASFSKDLLKPAPVLVNVSVAQESLISGVARLDFEPIEDIDFRGVRLWVSETDPVNVELAPAHDGLSTPRFPFTAGLNYLVFVPMDILGLGTPVVLEFEGDLLDVQALLEASAITVSELVEQYGELITAQAAAANAVIASDAAAASALISQEAAEVALSTSAKIRRDLLQIALQGVVAAEASTLSANNHKFDDGLTTWKSQAGVVITMTMPIRAEVFTVTNEEGTTYESRDAVESAIALAELTDYIDGES